MGIARSGKNKRKRLIKQANKLEQDFARNAVSPTTYHIRYWRIAGYESGKSRVGPNIVRFTFGK